MAPSLSCGQNPGRRAALTLVLLAAFAVPARSVTFDELSGLFTEKFKAIATTARSGDWDAYVTGFAWHAPWAYNNSTRGRLNEAAWGGGIGRSMRDGDGDRHSVYVMGFADSHRDPQFAAGYAWHRYWTPARNWHIGFGYMAFLTSRKDVAHHWPIPAVLPCLSIRCRRFEVLGLFVPRVSKDIKGDVFMVFTRIAL